MSESHPNTKWQRFKNSSAKKGVELVIKSHLPLKVQGFLVASIAQLAGHEGQTKVKNANLANSAIREHFQLE